MGLLRGAIDSISAKLAFFPPTPSTYEVGRKQARGQDIAANCQHVALYRRAKGVQVKAHDDRPDELYILPLHRSATHHILRLLLPE